MKMPAEVMAGKLHLQLVKETAQMQERVVMMRAVQKEFGDNALWGSPWFQTHTALTHSRDSFDRTIKRDLERINENLETIRELEAIFERKEEADIKDMVNYVRQRHGLDEEVK
jgi:hypothetical protein